MLLVGTGQKHPCICFRVLYRSEGQQRSRSRYRYSCTRGIRRQASSLSCRACKLSSGRQEDRTIGTESMTWQWDVRRNAHVSMKADGGFFAKVSAEKLCRCQEVCPLQTPARSCRPLLASSKLRPTTSCSSPYSTSVLQIILVNHILIL